MASNVKVGSARIDESGKASGGKAGDQTGKELSTQNWYKHSKGWRVFRPVNREDAEKIAQDMQWACDNSHIGYDQGQRTTLYNVAKDVGFNCKKVTKNCETDCSALVRVCCAYAGIDLPSFRTTNEGTVLLNSGKFKEMVGTKYTESQDYLKRGDILVTKTQGHTVIVLNDGKYAQTDKPEIYKAVIVTGGSVNIRTAPNTETGKIIGVVYKGNALEYQGETSDNNWYLVVYKNKNGWISGKYSKLTT